MTNKEYYLKNKHKWIRDTEEKKERHRQLSRESSARHREKRTATTREWNSSNYEKVLYNQAKRSSKYRGLEFNLELSDINIPKYCPYLEIELTSTQGDGVVWSNASIDRIDNDKGYIKGNIMVISRLANSMKQHSSVGNLITFAFNVLSLHFKNRE